MSLLVDARDRDLPDPGPQPGLPVCAPEPAVRRTRPGRSGEPLVLAAGRIAVLPVYSYPEFGFTAAPPEIVLRAEVLDRLVSASRALPPGFDLVVLDGWRSREFQVELMAYYSGRHGTPVTGYVADPDDEELVPPHTTGGAVDLTLRYGGVPLALGTDFDEFGPAAHLAAMDSGETMDGGDAGDGSRVHGRLRRLLARVLVGQQFAPHPLEWWHWSFGDQRWAAQYRRGAARYGRVRR